MKQYFLLPHYYFKAGLWIMVLFLIMFGIDLAGVAPEINIPMPYIANEIFGKNAWFGILPSEDMYMEIWMLGIFISLLFIAMSKEKTEDEMIMQIRLKSVFSHFGLRLSCLLLKLCSFSTLPMLTVFGPLFMYC